jgi:riboflavin biosynthesis pyrimidine reductase
VTEALQPLAAVGAPLPARAFVESLGLRAPPRGPRPRVAAAMIASADGRVAIAGRSVALGHPADRALLRELRTEADAILVGAGTLSAERYVHLLDDDQRAHRLRHGRSAHPLVATISRRLDVPRDVPLFGEPDVPVLVYTESSGELDGVPVARLAPLTLAVLLRDLRAERGADLVLCEGGPVLLRELLAAGGVDDLLLTVSPLLVAGDAPTMLAGAALDPPPGLALAATLRADDHLFLHYRVLR